MLREREKYLDRRRFQERRLDMMMRSLDMRAYKAFLIAKIALKSRHRKEPLNLCARINEAEKEKKSSSDLRKAWLHIILLSAIACFLLYIFRR